MTGKKARLIPFYLPQFYPIPENDEWWGKGFTEWTNVKKAKPLYQKHYQPHVPGELGYYDLRDPGVRIKQAHLAKEHGVEGFCYWHYWFGGGKRLLERVFDEVVRTGIPDLPFCLAWANISWSGIWHGAPGRVLVEQKYPGIEDYKAHFYALLEAFRDKRYMRVDGKPIFVVFQPKDLPNLAEFTSCWRDLSRKEGLPGIYFVGVSFSLSWDHRKDGFDAFTSLPPKECINRFNYGREGIINRWIKRLINKSLPAAAKNIISGPHRYNHRELLDYMVPNVKENINFLPDIMSNWDNTPRCGRRGYVLEGSTPELFRIVLKKAIEQVSGKRKEEKIIFIRSWNEWAEGNYLEPDTKFGRGYLKAIKEEIFEA